MFHASTSRRGFLVGCSAAIAAMAGAKLNFVAFGMPEEEPEQEILVVVSLRGGCDGINLVAPIGGADRVHYESYRRNLRVPSTGAGAALPLGGMSGTDTVFGLHPSAAPLHPLYQQGHLAIVHATGLEHNTRSHFDAIEYIERGTPGDKGTSSGWLTRHLGSAPTPSAPGVLPALAVGTEQVSAFLGQPDTVVLEDMELFSYQGHWKYGAPQRAALRDLYAGESGWLHTAGLATLRAVEAVESHYPGEYVPGNGARYPDHPFADQLKVIAQTIKMQVGLRVATVEFGGWDTHEYQGDGSGGYFASELVAPFASALSAFYTDLAGSGSANYARRTTILVMSEFGRRLRENGSGGSDHGHGNVMFLLGGSVNGGRIHGQWPGIHPEQLYDHADLAIRTDYRQVLSELSIRRLRNPNLGVIFPQYRGYRPLGIVQGSDLPPIYDGPVSYDHHLYLPYANR